MGGATKVGAWGGGPVEWRHVTKNEVRHTGTGDGVGIGSEVDDLINLKFSLKGGGDDGGEVVKIPTNQ